MAEKSVIFFLCLKLVGFRFSFLLKFLSNILKMKTQAIGVSHTRTDSCCLWVEEQYGYALGKQHKSQPVFYGWISVIPSLKYSQIRKDLLRFVPWLTENLPRKKSATQKSKIFIGFSVAESAGRLTPFKL